MSVVLVSLLLTAEACLEPSQASTMELFWKNSFKLNAEMSDLLVDFTH